MKKTLTILGSSRQDSICDIDGYQITNIRDKITHTHYTGEILQSIRYCKYNNITPRETVECFRTPILSKKPLCFNDIKNDYNKTELFILEIASKLSYKYNNKYVNYILQEFNDYKDKIIVETETNEDIENNIVEIIKEINIPLIIVGYIVTYNKGSRYDLLKFLEKLCMKYNIFFIDPVKEITKEGYNINDLIKKEDKITNYNELGHSVIKKIYVKYISQLRCNVKYFKIYEIPEYNKVKIGDIDDDGNVILLNDYSFYDLLITCGTSNHISFEDEFLREYPIPCIVFNDKINKLHHNNKNTNIKFIKKNISNSNTEDTTNLLDLIENNDNIFLKMDIESNEYKWLEIITREHLLKISQIVIKFHYTHKQEFINIFTQISIPINPLSRINCLKKIMDTHYLVHLKCNNTSGTTLYNGIVVPNIFDCTYIRKDLCNIDTINYSIEKIPNPLLDCKNEITLLGFPYQNI
jgi:hypothetical protein